MSDAAHNPYDNGWGAEMVNRSSGKFLGVDAVGWLGMSNPQL